MTLPSNPTPNQPHPPTQGHKKLHEKAHKTNYFIYSLHKWNFLDGSVTQV